MKVAKHSSHISQTSGHLWSPVLVWGRLHHHDWCPSAKDRNGAQWQLWPPSLTVLDTTWECQEKEHKPYKDRYLMIFIYTVQACIYVYSNLNSFYSWCINSSLTCSGVNLSSVYTLVSMPAPSCWPLRTRKKSTRCPSPSRSPARRRRFWRCLLLVDELPPLWKKRTRKGRRRMNQGPIVGQCESQLTPVQVAYLCLSVFPPKLYILIFFGWKNIPLELTSRIVKTFEPNWCMK